MTTSYPLDLPSTTAIRSVRWMPENVVAVDVNPLTRASRVYDWGGRQLIAEVELIPMKRATAAAWQAFFRRLRGTYGTFRLGDPAGAMPRGTATGTPLVNGASQTGEDLITDGWTINITNILRAGDYVQIGDVLYMNTVDVNSNGSGQATLSLWPELRSSPADNAALTVNSAKGLFRLAANAVPEDIDTALIYGFSFRAMEALS